MRASHGDQNKRREPRMASGRKPETVSSRCRARAGSRSVDWPVALARSYPCVKVSVAAM